MHLNRRVVLRALALATAVVSGAALAQQSYPTKPIRAVIGFPTSSAPDTMLRMIAERMGTLLGQPVVVENRPGAAGTIAGTLVAGSPPDGYTLMMALAASMSVGPHLLPSAKYNPAKDFAPIGLIQRGPYYIALRTDVPINTFAELVAHGKAKPGELNYASPGIGTQHHLTMELIQLLTGAKFTHIPMTGTGQGITETIGGRTQMIIDGAGVQFAAQARAGKLKLIGMTGAQPLAIFPGVVPLAQQGLADFQSHSWWGLVAPAGTPQAIITRLNTELNKVLAMPEIIERLTAEGSITGGRSASTPEEFGRWIAAEYERWGKVIKDTGIKLQ